MYYRITTHTDSIHYYTAENEPDAKKQHYDLHDPYATDHVDAMIWGIRTTTAEEKAKDLKHNNATDWGEE